MNKTHFNRGTVRLEYGKIYCCSQTSYLRSLSKMVIGQVDIIFVDLKNAFDTVNYNLLINELNSFCVGNPTHNLFSSNSPNRMQFVKIDNSIPLCLIFLLVFLRVVT